MRKLLKTVFLLIIPLVFLTLVASGALSHKVKPGEQAITETAAQGVRTEIIKVSNVPRKIEITGTVQADQVVQIASKLMAHVTKVNVHEGSRVSSGQTLVALDPSEVRAQVNQASAGKQAANVEYNYARTTYERFKNMYQLGGVTKQELDNAETRFRQAQAAVEQARANSQLAAVSNSYATITAPSEGVITKKMVEAGDIAAPGQLLLTLEQSPYYLEVAVQESLSGQVKVGQQVKVQLDALEDIKTGRIFEVIPAVDPASHTFIAKIMLPDAPAIRSGMYGKAYLEVGQYSTILVPETALVRWSEFTGVFVIDSKNMAHLQYISPGETVGDHVEIVSGLHAGDCVITEGKEQVRDGERVVLPK